MYCISNYMYLYLLIKQIKNSCTSYNKVIFT